MEKRDGCAFAVDEREVLGRECYGGLDLSSSIDITAFVLGLLRETIWRNTSFFHISGYRKKT